MTCDLCGRPALVRMTQADGEAVTFCSPCSDRYDLCSGCFKVFPIGELDFPGMLRFYLACKSCRDGRVIERRIA